MNERPHLGLPLNYRGRNVIPLSTVRRQCGGFGGLRRGRGGLLSPPVFKEGLGVVFQRAMITVSSPPTADLIIIPNRI